MIYIIEESWNYPDEMEHSYYRQSFSDEESALAFAKELVKDEESFFKEMNKEYHLVTFYDGYHIETTDLEFGYTVTVISIKEAGSMIDFHEVTKIYEFIYALYKKFVAINNQDPDFVEVSIRWKDNNETERATIAFNEKHDELVTFRVNNLLELSLLFFMQYNEDFICEYVHDICFGIWDG